MASDKIHIERNTVQETLVIPLFGRKVCTDLYGDFFSDRKAVELIGRLDYDFGDQQARSRSLVERFGALEVAARQKAFAYEVRQYLLTHPKAAVVNLGCGLDQTGESCDNGACRIYNVDFPDVISIREQLIPAGQRVTNVAADLNDPAWMHQIPREEGAVFFGSGVFYYFTQKQMEQLVNGMAAYFHDGVLAFDIGGKQAVKMAVKTWVRQAGIDGVDTSFYVSSIDKQIRPWLRRATVSSKGYMLGYFDLKEPSIPGFFRFLSRIGDGVMKMQIIRIAFDPLPEHGMDS